MGVEILDYIGLRCVHVGGRACAHACKRAFVHASMRAWLPRMWLVLLAGGVAE